MDRFKKGLAIGLVVSLCANAYLVKRVLDWQDAWLEQFLTTYDVETLYKNSGADTSLSAVEDVIKKQLGEYHVVSEANSVILAIGNKANSSLPAGTRFYFSDGKYSGSKANLPEHLTPWRSGRKMW